MSAPRDRRAGLTSGTRKSEGFAGVTHSRGLRRSVHRRRPRNTVRGERGGAASPHGRRPCSDTNPSLQRGREPRGRVPRGPDAAGRDGAHAFARSGWRASVVPKGESNTCCRVRVMNAVTVTERSVPVTGGPEADVAAVRLSQKGPCSPRSHRLCNCRDPLRSPIYPKSHRL